MNMSYCKFQNTTNDVQDCINSLFDAKLSGEEKAARRLLVEQAYAIIEMVGGTIEEDLDTIMRQVDDIEEHAMDDDDDFDSNEQN